MVKRFLVYLAITHSCAAMDLSRPFYHVLLAFSCNDQSDTHNEHYHRTLNRKKNRVTVDQNLDLNEIWKKKSKDLESESFVHQKNRRKVRFTPDAK